MSKKIPYRTYLSEEQMPKYWYNLRADMKEQHDPYIHPGTMKPVVLDDLLPVFCRELALQETNTTDRYATFGGPRKKRTVLPNSPFLWYPPAGSKFPPSTVHAACSKHMPPPACPSYTPKINVLTKK